MKRFFALAVLLFTMATISKADDIVAVTLQPTQFGSFTTGTIQEQTNGYETVGMSFDWNLTTRTLFDFSLTATGLFGEGLSIPEGFTTVLPGDEIDHLGFGSGDGRTQWQLNYSDHFLPGSPLFGLKSTPGTYLTDLYYRCGDCLIANDDFEIGSATVTQTPEPGTLLLLGSGLVGMLLLMKKL
jgi:hypothetical protein